MKKLLTKDKLLTILLITLLAISVIVAIYVNTSVYAETSTNHNVIYNVTLKSGITTIYTTSYEFSYSENSTYTLKRAGEVFSYNDYVEAISNDSITGFSYSDYEDLTCSIYLSDVSITDLSTEYTMGTEDVSVSYTYSCITNTNETLTYTEIPTKYNNYQYMDYTFSTSSLAANGYSGESTTKMVRCYNPIVECWCDVSCEWIHDTADSPITVTLRNGSSYSLYCDYWTAISYPAALKLTNYPVLQLGTTLTSFFGNNYCYGIVLSLFDASEPVSSDDRICIIGLTTEAYNSTSISLCDSTNPEAVFDVQYNLSGGTLSSAAVLSEQAYFVNNSLIFNPYAGSYMNKQYSDFNDWSLSSSEYIQVTYDNVVDMYGTNPTSITLYANWIRRTVTVDYYVPYNSTKNIHFVDTQYEGSYLRLAYNYSTALRKYYGLAFEFASSPSGMTSVGGGVLSFCYEYSFLGWTTQYCDYSNWDNNCSGYTKIANNQSLLLTENTTVYAMFSKNGKVKTWEWASEYENWLAPVSTDDTIPVIELGYSEDTGTFSYSGLDNNVIVCFASVYDYTIRASETYVYSSYSTTVDSTIELPDTSTYLAQLNDLGLTGDFAFYGWSTKYCDINIWESFASNNDVAQYDDYIIDDDYVIDGTTTLYAVCYLQSLNIGDVVIADGGEADQAPNNGLPQIKAAAESAWSTISSWFNDNILAKWTTIWSWLKWVLVAIAAVIVLAIVFKIVRLITS